MKYIYSTFLFIVFISFTAFSARAQEAQERIVDEVVAQVNNDVITLSRIKRETKAIVDSQVQAGKTREEAQKTVDDKQGELIANLINEELLIQKAKDLGLESEIEASLNQRLVQIMKQYNLKSLDALYEEMKKTGIDPEEIKSVWRKEATRTMVLQKEVQYKVYWAATEKDVKDYFDKNKARFTKPETVAISEIFLSFAGRDEAAVREKAKQLVAQLRAGADFAKIVTENSDRPDAATTKGKVDTFNLKDLAENFRTAIKDVKVGGYTDPIELDQVGINILRVDERSQASSESVFDDGAVRAAILSEKLPEATKKYMTALRDDSYIKISENYRPIVAPVLFAAERKEKAAN